jgi:hypothetical protein
MEGRQIGIMRYVAFGLAALLLSTSVVASVQVRPLSLDEVIRGIDALPETHLVDLVEKSKVSFNVAYLAETELRKLRVKRSLFEALSRPANIDPNLPAILKCRVRLRARCSSTTTKPLSMFRPAKSSSGPQFLDPRTSMPEIRSTVRISNIWISIREDAIVSTLFWAKTAPAARSMSFASLESSAGGVGRWSSRPHGEGTLSTAALIGRRHCNPQQGPLRQFACRYG